MTHIHGWSCRAPWFGGGDVFPLQLFYSDFLDWALVPEAFHLGCTPVSHTCFTPSSKGCLV